MPLYSEHISNMYYGGAPSYTSMPYSYSGSVSSLGTSYSAPYLNPGSSYSSHSSLGGYSRIPLTTRWITSSGRSYSPMLSTISERGTSSPVRINSPRRIPIMKRSYGTSSYTSRPININTADIDVSRDKYHNKRKSPSPTRSPQRYSPKEDKDSSPFMPRVDGKPETGIDSSPGTKRSTIKRGRTVVRLHTVKRKERDSPRKPVNTQETENSNEEIVDPKEDSNEGLKWREKLSEDLIYRGKTIEKKTLGTKLVEKFQLKDKNYSDNLIIKPQIQDSVQNLHETPSTNTESLATKFPADRRCSMELLAEQADLFDSLIRSENLSTATLDLTKIGIDDTPKTSLEAIQSIKRRKSNDPKNPLKTTKSDHSLHDNLKSLKDSRDTKQLSKRRSIKKSSSGGSICRLDSITEFPREPIRIELPAIEESRKLSVKHENTKTKPKPKLKAKITSSVDISTPTSPLKFKIENVTVEEKPRTPKKEITFSSAVDVELTSKEIKTKINPTSCTKQNSIKSVPESPEPEDGNFWNKIGKRETVYLLKRKQDIEENKEKHRRALFWYPEKEESEDETFMNKEQNKQVCGNNTEEMSNVNLQNLQEHKNDFIIAKNAPFQSNSDLKVKDHEDISSVLSLNKNILETKSDKGKVEVKNNKINNTYNKIDIVEPKKLPVINDLVEQELLDKSHEKEEKSGFINDETKSQSLTKDIQTNKNLNKEATKISDTNIITAIKKNIEAINDEFKESKKVNSEESFVPENTPVDTICNKEIQSTKNDKVVPDKNNSDISIAPSQMQIKIIQNTLDPEKSILENTGTPSGISSVSNFEKSNENKEEANVSANFKKGKEITSNETLVNKNMEKRENPVTERKIQNNGKKPSDTIMESNKLIERTSVKEEISKTETKDKIKSGSKNKEIKATSVIETTVTENNKAKVPEIKNIIVDSNKILKPLSKKKMVQEINKIETIKDTIKQSSTSDIYNKEEEKPINCTNNIIRVKAVKESNEIQIINNADILASNIASGHENNVVINATTGNIDNDDNNILSETNETEEKEVIKVSENQTITDNNSLDTFNTCGVQKVSVSENIPIIESQLEKTKEDNKAEQVLGENEQKMEIEKSLSKDIIKLPQNPVVKKLIKQEAAVRPLIATPRPPKKVPQIIHSSSSSETSSDEDSSDEDDDEDDEDDADVSDTSVGSTEFFECENNPDGRTSTGSNDSGFDSSAPTSPAGFVQIKKDCDVNCHRKCEKLTANLCGVNQRLLVEALASRTASKRGGDSPGTSTSTPAQGDTHDLLEQELEQSTAYGLFRKTGRFTPPARSIPRFRKYTIEDFHFIKVLGKGSFGKVLLAELRDTEYYYAVKCLKKDVVLEDDDVECTLIERKVLALGTNHPYLCHLFATFQTDSHLFFVMEYLNGGDLMFHIQQSGRFPEARARFYAAEIVSGLKFLHKRGIVYRDLKLDNILLDFDGHVRIADFGMCKLQIYLDKTADTFCGTPDYMAPEIIKGLKYNQAVDWWSFGVLLYEMLIGQSPFSGCDEDELFWSICNEMPSYPRFLSQQALTILTRLLDKDAKTRLGGAECMHGDIRDQEFFQPIHWEKLETRELEAPFKPRVRHPLDTQYFDRAFTGERPRLTAVEPHVLRSMDQGPFRGFSYTNPNATDR
ncbi:LOW QUALITY PROTEIN: protein kinase C delta [Aphomia sociella]